MKRLIPGTLCVVMSPYETYVPSVGFVTAWGEPKAGVLRALWLKVPIGSLVMIAASRINGENNAYVGILINLQHAFRFAWLDTTYLKVVS